MHELFYTSNIGFSVLMGGSNKVNTTYAALGGVFVAVVCIILLLITRKKTYKNGGDVLVNRNDPKKDYITWELMSFPDEWKDGDKLIFTVKEHKLDKEESK